MGEVRSAPNSARRSSVENGESSVTANDAIHHATSGQHTLSNAYDAFIRNRFYEHDAASKMHGDLPPTNTPKMA